MLHALSKSARLNRSLLDLRSTRVVAASCTKDISSVLSANVHLNERLSRRARKLGARGFGMDQTHLDSHPLGQTSSMEQMTTRGQSITSPLSQVSQSQSGQSVPCQRGRSGMSIDVFHADTACCFFCRPVFSADLEIWVLDIGWWEERVVVV